MMRKTIVSVALQIVLGLLLFAAVMSMVSWVFSWFIETDWTYPITAVATGILAPITFGFGFWSSAWMILPVIVGLAILRQSDARKVPPIGLGRVRTAVLVIAMFAGLGYTVAQSLTDVFSSGDQTFLVLRMDIAAFATLTSVVLLDIRTSRRTVQSPINSNHRR
jgi:hypothetical protein